MKKLLITLLLTLTSMSAMAEWTEFSGSSNNGSVKTYYSPVNAATHGHITRIWRIKDYMKPQAASNKTYLSEKSLLEINCKTKMHRTLAYTQYQQNMGGGESVFKNSNPAEWESIGPDVTGGAARKHYCSKE